MVDAARVQWITVLTSLGNWRPHLTCRLFVPLFLLQPRIFTQQTHLRVDISDLTLPPAAAKTLASDKGDYLDMPVWHPLHLAVSLMYDADMSGRSGEFLSWGEEGDPPGSATTGALYQTMKKNTREELVAACGGDEEDERVTKMLVVGVSFWMDGARRDNLGRKNQMPLAMSLMNHARPNKSHQPAATLFVSRIRSNEAKTNE